MGISIAALMLIAFRWFRYLGAPVVVLLGASLCPPAHAQGQNSAEDFNSLAGAAAVARDENEVEEAIREYRKALELQPDWKEGLWYVGTLEYERDHYTDAIPALRRLVELAPESGAAWNFLGLCEFETREYALAAQHLSKGQYYADDPEILRVAKYHLALLDLRSGNFDGANGLLQSLVVQGAIGAQMKTALGLALLRVPLWPEQVNPSQEALLQEVGQAGEQLAQGQMAAALQSFQAMVAKYPDTPYLHLAYGSALLAAGKAQQAVVESRGEIAKSPQSSAAHELLGKSLEAAGEPEKARREFAVAKKLPVVDLEQRIVLRYENRSAAAAHGETESGPSNAKGEGASLSFEELSRQADAANAAGNTNLAMRDYQQALELRGDWQEGWWKLAMVSYAAQHYAEAIAALKRWVARSPEVGTAWAVMGLSEFELKDYDNAVIHLQRGQQLGLSGSPESVQLARYRLGILLNRNKQFENAEGVLMSVAGSGPMAGEVRFALGMSLLRMGTLPDEVENNKRTLVSAVGEIAELLKESRYDEAFPKFEALIQRYPEAAYLQYVYGTALATLSRYDEAELQFQQEISRSPGSELPYLQLASIALKRHRAEAAQDSAQRAVKLAPSSAEGHYLLGRAYLEIGDGKLAVSELERAASMAPESAQIHFNLAKAYSKAGDAEKAGQERAIFSRLNALEEQRRSLQGSQSYGAHNAVEVGVPRGGNGRPE
jgi:tetratricopeptide (TPR) repeat protein